MTEEDRGEVARLLREAGLFTASEIEWMSDSCPSIDAAKKLIRQRKERSRDQR